MPVAVRIKKTIGNFCLDVDFESRASRIGILGASGCGKSMALKSIAGIETPDSGEICINGKTVFSSAEKWNMKPQRRSIGYLFQNYALFPTMTVAENIGAGLKGNKEERKRRIQEMLASFQLMGLENRFPAQLSGGQQQRVALARIMAYEPEMILLDEPFSALDLFLKDRLQQELEEMLEDYKGTVIMVSHDRDEIYQFSEELVVMEQGRTIICGRTKDIFENPGKREAARLTGCKNFSRLKRLDGHRAAALDWGIELRLERKIPEDIVYAGFRAHEFVPVWGERRENCLKLSIAQIADFPFEKHFYIWPEGEKMQEMEKICWFVQKGNWKMLKERGMPDYLQLPEEKVMLLK